MVAGDFNGDALPDVAVIDGGGVNVYLGNGDGTLQSPVKSPVPVALSSLLPVDVTGDGVLDLAALNGGSVRILQGNGDGTFQLLPNTYGAGTGAIALATSDLNGDGAPDLAVANSNSNDVSILLNQADWGSAPTHATRRLVAADPRATPSTSSGQLVLGAPALAFRSPLPAGMKAAVDKEAGDRLFASAAAEPPRPVSSHLPHGPAAESWLAPWEDDIQLAVMLK